MSTGLQHIFYGEIEKIIPELSSKQGSLIKSSEKNIKKHWSILKRYVALGT